jgi:hypothetical protein
MPYSRRPATAATILVEICHCRFRPIYPDIEDVRTSNSKGADKQENRKMNQVILLHEKARPHIGICNNEMDFSPSSSLQ